MFSRFTGGIGECYRPCPHFAHFARLVVNRGQWLQGKRGHHLPASATATPSSMSTAVTSPHLDARRVGAPYGSKDLNVAVQPHSLSKSRPRIRTSLSRSKTSKIEKFRPESAAACVFFCDFFLFNLPFGRGACSGRAAFSCFADPTPNLFLSHCACSLRSQLVSCET